MAESDPNVPYGYCHCGCGTKTNLAVRTNPVAGHVLGEPYKFVNGHRHRYKHPQTYIIEDRGYQTPCWIWQGGIDKIGYGWLSRGGTIWRAHRWYYTQNVGAVPDGLELDHLCRVRECVNPTHLEPVTHQENMRRSRVTKLTQQKADAIRSATGSSAAVAARFGVGRTTVKAIRNGARWKV